MCDYYIASLYFNSVYSYVALNYGYWNFLFPSETRISTSEEQQRHLTIRETNYLHPIGWQTCSQSNLKLVTLLALLQMISSKSNNVSIYTLADFDTHQFYLCNNGVNLRKI